MSLLLLPPWLRDAAGEVWGLAGAAGAGGVYGGEHGNFFVFACWG